MRDGILSPFGRRRFSVNSLFVANEPGFYGEVMDLTLWQDTARTSPVTAVGQAVASWQLNTATTPIYAEQATPGKRPLYARVPANGIRNLANGSADVGNAAFWAASGSNNGITVTRSGNGFDTDGLSYNDWVVSGTAAAGSIVQLRFASASRLSASLGQQYTISALVQVIAGTAPSATNGVRVSFDGETAPTTFVEFSGGTAVAPTTETVTSRSYTLANAASNQVNPTVAIVTQSGVTVSYTIRIKALQFELGSTRTAYQFNYSNVNISEPPFAQVGALLYDGVDDAMQTPAVNFSTTDKVTVITGVRKTSDAARGIVVELGVGAAAAAFLIDAPGASGATQRYRFASIGTLAAVPETAVGPAPDTAVISGLGDISGDSAILRRNGVQVNVSAADQGTGNYANAIVYFGARGGTSLFFKGYLYGIIARGATTSGSALTNAEAWMNARTGAY